MPAITPSPFQASVLDEIPLDINLFLGGGRGGGKSYILIFLILRHEQLFGAQSAQLYIRRSFPAIRDFERLTRSIFGQLYRHHAQYNASDHIWRMPHKGTFELSQLLHEKDYDKFQGRSFGQLIVDEAGQFPMPDLIDTMRSNLRGQKGMPTRTVLAANPGGAGHAWLYRRFAAKPPWTVFYDDETEAEWMHIPSTYKDNPTIDQAEYEMNIRGASKHDPELQKAWLTGDWAIARGAFFSDVIYGVKQETFTREQWHDWLAEQDNPGWILENVYLAHDWGSSAPSATYLMWRSHGCLDNQGRYWPEGAIAVLDEYATYQAKRYHAGTGETPAELAVGIIEMCGRWGVEPYGVADDACFAKTKGWKSKSIADDFKDAGVLFEEAKKGDRVTGWTHLRTLMKQAEQTMTEDGVPPEKPFMVIDPRCEYAWQTVPTLVRHPRKPEDIAEEQADHGADALRYGSLWRGRRVEHIPAGGEHYTDPDE